MAISCAFFMTIFSFLPSSHTTLTPTTRPRHRPRNTLAKPPSPSSPVICRSVMVVFCGPQAGSGVRDRVNDKRWGQSTTAAFGPSSLTLIRAGLTPHVQAYTSASGNPSRKRRNSDARPRFPACRVLPAAEY